jgi:hypothetical protein
MRRSAGELRHDALDGLAHVPFDAALDALGHVRRRELLFELLEVGRRGDASVALADSADTGTHEHGVAAEDTHLPKLVEYGYVSWNRDAEEVRRGPDFDEIEPLLELLSDHEDELQDV